jgi:hypothetical protein
MRKIRELMEGGTERIGDRAERAGERERERET